MPFNDLTKPNFISKSEKKQPKNNFKSVEMFYEKNINKNINLLKSSLNKNKEFLSLLEEKAPNPNKTKKLNELVIKPKILKPKSPTKQIPLIPPVTLENSEKPGFRSSAIFESPRKLQSNYNSNNFKKSPGKKTNELSADQKKYMKFKKLISDNKLFKVEPNNFNSNLIQMKSMNNINLNPINEEEERPKNMFISHFLNEVNDAIINSPKRKRKEQRNSINSDSETLIKNLEKNANTHNTHSTVNNNNTNTNERNNSKEKDYSNLPNLNLNTRENMNSNTNGNENTENNNTNTHETAGYKTPKKKQSLKRSIEIFENLDNENQNQENLEIKEDSDMIDSVKDTHITVKKKEGSSSNKDKEKTNNTNNNENEKSRSKSKEKEQKSKENIPSNNKDKELNLNLTNLKTNFGTTKSKIFNSLNINLNNLDFNSRSDVNYITNKIQNQLISNSMSIQNTFNVEGIKDNLKIEKLNVNPNDIYATSSDSKYLHFLKNEEESEEKKKLKKNLRNSILSKIKTANKIPRIPYTEKKESNISARIRLPILKSNNVNNISNIHSASNKENLYKNFNTNSTINNNPNSMENSNKQIHKINVDHLKRSANKPKILNSLEEKAKLNNNMENEKQGNAMDQSLKSKKDSNKTDSFLNMKFEKNLTESDSEFSLNSMNPKNRKSLNSSLLHLNKDETEYEYEDSSYSDTDSEEIRNEEKDKVNEDDFDWKTKQLLLNVKKATMISPTKNKKKYGRKYSVYDKEILKFFDKNIKNEEHDPEVKNIYGMMFRKDMKNILELRKYIQVNSNQTEENKNIERRKFASKSYVNKYICDMKEKVHFMKGILDYSFSKYVTHKQKLLSERAKKKYLVSKLGKIKDLRIDEVKELLIFISDLKNLDLNNFIEEDPKNLDKDKSLNQEGVNSTQNYNESSFNNINSNNYINIQEKAESFEDNKTLKKRRSSLIMNPMLPSINQSTMKRNSSRDSIKDSKVFKPLSKIYEEIKQVIEKTDMSLLKELDDTKNESLMNFIENKAKANKNNSSMNNSIFNNSNTNLNNSNSSTQIFQNNSFSTVNNSIIADKYNITNANNYKTQVKISDLFSSLPVFYKNYKKESQLIDRNFKVNPHAKPLHTVKLPKIRAKRASRLSDKLSKISKSSKGIDCIINTTLKSQKKLKKIISKSPRRNKYYLSLINFNGKYTFNKTNMENDKENLEDFMKLDYSCTDTEDERRDTNNSRPFRKKRGKNFRNSMPGLKPKNKKDFDIESNTDYNVYKAEPILEIENEEKIDDLLIERNKPKKLIEDVYNISKYMKLTTKNNINYQSTEDFHTNIEANRNMFTKKKFMPRSRKSSIIENLNGLKN